MYPHHQTVVGSPNFTVDTKLGQYLVHISETLPQHFSLLSNSYFYQFRHFDDLEEECGLLLLFRVHRYICVTICICEGFFVVNCNDFSSACRFTKNSVSIRNTLCDKNIIRQHCDSLPGLQQKM